MVFEGQAVGVSSVFIDGGEMGSLMRSLDWSQTPLGDSACWPQSLRSAVSILLPSKAQICLFWGPELITIYNDAYLPALALKHPWALGRPACEVWSELWDVIEPLLHGVVSTGEAFWGRDHLFFLNRRGYLEETYFDVSYDPVRDESGGVGGIFCIVSETTGRVVGDRRLQTLSLLARETAMAKTVPDACHTAIAALTTNAHDIPFALLYQVSGEQAILVGMAGFTSDRTSFPAQINLRQEAGGWALGQVFESGAPTLISGLAEKFDDLPTGAWDRPPTDAWVVPLLHAGEQITGFLVLGINPYQVFEKDYREFFDLISRNVATAIRNARTYAEERQRVETLAKLDRAKTTFFSNVSHEFRTPLTLMLPPLEAVLEEVGDSIPPQARSQLEMVQRNGNRLLKLVNTLLDFSRIEAGRTQVNHEPTDLATYTAELASVFRSAIEHAGLRFTVDCPALPEPIYIDREMWEKVILNLLSNAFKFTFSGEIAVSLRWCGGGESDNAMMRASDDAMTGEAASATLSPSPTLPHIQLDIRDTGTGIPTEDLPHLFERFHRVAGARGRTFEGTGIGLSLVQELVHLQGGTIAVESTPGQGSCFTVRIPAGTAHLETLLQGDRPLERNNRVQSDRGKSYVEEALGWLPISEGAEAASPESSLRTPVSRARVLLADDNADMRAYLHRILGEFYEVFVVADGATALATARACTPDLVLIDVMMPGMDGFELLRRLRAESKTREIPVLLLSARAGEEASVEGLQAGADDYLVKPFRRRDLLARVAANLEMGRSRRAEARRRTDTILESMTDGFVAVDREWRYIYVNPRAEQVLKRSRAEMLGNRIWDMFPALQATEMGEKLRQSMTQQVSDSLESYYAPLNVWFDVRLYPSSEGLSIYFQDISDRKRSEAKRQQAEAALSQSEDRYRKLFESIDEGFCVIEILFDENRTPVDYVFLETNPAFEQQTGLRSPMGKRARQLVPNLEDHWVEMYGRVALTGEATRFENGSEAMGRWFDVYAFPYGNPDQCQVAILFTDITHRKRAELALKNREQYFRQLANTMPQMVWVTDPNGKLQFINDRWTELTGLMLNEMYDPKLVQQFIPAEDQQTLAQQWAIALQIQEEFEYEFRLKPLDATEYRWFLARAVPVFDEKGQILCWSGTSTDITALKQAREQAEQANRVKDEFLAVLSHEIRTPLNPIMGWVKLLRSGRLNEEKRAYALETIERNTQLQTQLIEDLLDVSRILRGKLSLAIAPVNLVAVVEAARETVRLAAEAKAIDLQLIIPDQNSPLQVLGDFNRLQQVVWNLLSNAVKFSPNNGRVEAVLEPIDSVVQLRVQDWGEGIDPAFLPHIFEYFRQADGTTTRRFGGLGLGLAIARHLVELHGGTLQADSPGSGQGATFTVRLPAARRPPSRHKPDSESAVLPNSSAAPLADLNVLVVDDDTDTRDLLVYILEQAGAKVTAVASAIAALDQFAQQPPDVLVSDVGMPEMDGYTLMQQLRANFPEQVGQIPAIALTAYASEMNQQQAIAAGFRQHLTKPVDPNALVGAIVNLLS